MKAPEIDYENQEVFHRGYYIQLKKLKNLTEELWPELVSEYSFGKRFNSKTGEIHKNVAWDNVFHLVNKKIAGGNGIKSLLNLILVNENLI
jgi:hypothetical protein